MKRNFDDPYLQILWDMGSMSITELKILREYTTKLKTAYAEKAQETNGTRTCKA